MDLKYGRTLFLGLETCLAIVPMGYYGIKPQIGNVYTATFCGERLGKMELTQVNRRQLSDVLPSDFWETGMEPIKVIREGQEFALSLAESWRYIWNIKNQTPWVWILRYKPILDHKLMPSKDFETRDYDYGSFDDGWRRW